MQRGAAAPGRSPNQPRGEDAASSSESVETQRPTFRGRLWTGLALIGLLAFHYGAAARSLLQENPTVDEVTHLPAGVSYWQKGTFRLYHHNPPLFKLVAALPVVMAHPQTDELYVTKAWRAREPAHPTFSQWFARRNASRYFELFQLARLTMPLFSIVGGLVVYAWSRALYGAGGGFLSLVLWIVCPNILAHARLITSDVCSTALGAGATYLFWRYLGQPTWRRALVAAFALGCAQLTKFSMLLLLGIWPFLWLVRLGALVPRSQWPRQILSGLMHGPAMFALCILTVNAGYFFEGVGTPLGEFEFASQTLTRPVTTEKGRPSSENQLLEAAWRFRVNRFRGTWLDRLPVPLPEHYLQGFDEQKLET
jgi:hypothetical protein